MGIHKDIVTTGSRDGEAKLRRKYPEIQETESSFAGKINYCMSSKIDKSDEEKPLLAAVKRGALETVEKLLEDNAKLYDEKRYMVYEASMLAVKEVEVGILKLIVEKSPNRSSILGQILCAAVKERNPTVLKFCLDGKEDISLEDLRSAFMLAAKSNQRFMLQKLYSIGLLTSEDVVKALEEIEKWGFLNSENYLKSIGHPSVALS